MAFKMATNVIVEIVSIAFYQHINLNAIDVVMVIGYSFVVIHGE